MKKILVIRLSSIGDIVLTSPVLRCLKEQVSDCKLHFLVKKKFYPVVRANPHLDHIHTLEENGLKPLSRELKEEKFDFIVDLHKNLRSTYLKQKLKVAASGFPKCNYEKWLLTRFKINRMPGLHVVDRYFKALQPLNVTNDGKGLEYFIPKEEEADLSNLPGFLKDGYIGFVIGARHNTKIFPPEKVAELIDRLEEPIILLGGKEDHERAGQIMKMSNKQIFNACGKFSLNQSASLVKQARQIITNDTGLMHIAAAFGKKIVSLWGNTVPEFGMYPYLPGQEERSMIFEVKGLRCRPCSKLGYDRCPKGHFKCMREIDTNQIANAINNKSNA
ncbi:MAG: glycosyltransferase family 9 protein [Bacteroidales bacterium]|nr:glycosyltransferase family 9 protein [Bacteroidales bacterium]MCF8343194.1 glycosyltransferase family 9 protein [Bacteroidales bacterium]MCF8377277.1 glycosyltransferase family 9 protein [Bacteroidales bacterium]MCF8401101.1 glycosyltransferase family 9 protein [Bacteroidales bacterium]